MTKVSNPTDHSSTMHEEPRLQFCVGFCFLLDTKKNISHVLLIRKNRPKWQAGYLNGIGGEITENELPIQAMLREFHEETGLQTTSSEWYPSAHLVAPNNAHIHVFGMTLPKKEFPWPIISPTDEKLEMIPYKEILFERTDLVHDIRWLITLTTTLMSSRYRKPLMLEGKLKSEYL